VGNTLLRQLLQPTGSARRLAGGRSARHRAAGPDAPGQVCMHSRAFLGSQPSEGPSSCLGPRRSPYTQPRSASLDTAMISPLVTPRVLAPSAGQSTITRQRLTRFTTA